MVVSVIILACFIKLTSCNPYFSSIPNAKVPANAVSATNISPGGNTNQASPGLEPYNSYSYNIHTLPAEEPIINDPNKAISRSITPLPVPAKVAQRESKMNTNVDDSSIPKLTSDTLAQKYQHKPFSENFNNFRENLLKKMNSDLINKLQISPGNVKNGEAGVLNQTPKLTAYQTSPLTTKGNYPDNVINYNNIPKDQENERTTDAFLKPVSAFTYKDSNVDFAKMSSNGLQIPRVPHNNNFGKLNQNTQPTHNTIYDVSNNGDNSMFVPVQQLRELPSKPQETPILNPAPAAINQNLLPPYKKENVFGALDTLYQNNLPQLDFLALNQQLISDDQAFKENLLQRGQNSTFQPAQIFKSEERNLSRKLGVPYYNNYYQPFSRSYNQLIYGNQTYKNDKFEKNTTDYNEVQQIVPEMYHVPPYLQETPSVITNLEMTNQPSPDLYKETGNLSQIMSTAYYNNFNKPFLLSQQLISTENKFKERQIENVDSTFNSVGIKESQMPHVPPNPQGFSSQDNSSKIIGEPAQVLINEERYPSYNFNQPISRPFSQRLTPSNQFLKENQIAKVDSNLYINTLQSTLSSASQQESILEESNKEFISQPTLPLSQENITSQNQIACNQLQTLPAGNQSLAVEKTRLPLSYQEGENKSQKWVVPYPNNGDSFNSRPYIEVITDNQQLKESQSEKTSPLTAQEMNINCNSCNHNVTYKNTSQLQPIGTFSLNPQQNILQIAIPEISNQPAMLGNKEESKLNNNIVTKDYVPEELSYQQPLSELAIESLGNIPEYVQLIDGSENMRTKNAISTPVYNVHDANTRITPSYKNTFNSLYSLRELNQQGLPYNQIFKDNNQLLKTNKNVQPQETTYGIMNKMLDRKEARLPLFIPKGYDEYLKNYQSESQDDSQVVKSNPLINSQDMNNNGIPANINISNTKSQIGSPLVLKTDTTVLKPFDTKDAQYSVTNVSSNHRNDSSLLSTNGHQILQNNNQPVKSYQAPSIERDTNKTLTTNDDKEQKRHQNFEINIPSQILDISRGSPTVSVDISQGTPKVRNEVPEYFDESKPQKTPLPQSQNVSQAKNESQDNKISYYNNFISINSNVLNKQLFDETQSVKEDPIDKLIVINEGTFPKLDIKINIPNSNNENSPTGITLAENLDESCIDNDKENKIPFKCINDTPKTDKTTTNAGIIIGFTEKAHALTNNDNTISTNSTSTVKEVIPTSELDKISGYLVDKILSAIKSFLKQSNSNNCNNENSFEIENRNNSNNNGSCGYGGLAPRQEIPLQQINPPEESNKIRSATTPLQDIKEVNNPILVTNSTNNQYFENVRAEIQASTSYNLNLSLSDSNSSNTSDRCPYNANKNENTSLNQISQVLLPYYYYSDRISLSSNENQTEYITNLADVKEVISPDNDASEIPSIIDKNPEVTKTNGPKPCLSKITVNILPATEKSTHDNILVFL